MKRLLLATVILPALIIPLCGCQRQDALPTSTSTAIGMLSVVDGKPYIFHVTDEMLTASPPYEPEQMPQIPITQAVQLAKDTAAQYFASNSEWQKWTLQEVTLRTSWISNKWYYLVTFVPPLSRDDRGLVTEEGLRIPVLLNGQVAKGEAGSP